MTQDDATLPTDAPAAPADGADQQDWPTHCEQCGTRLQSAVVDQAPDLDSAHLQTASPATVVAQDFCPNPECPARKPGGEPGAEQAGQPGQPV